MSKHPDLKKCDVIGYDNWVNQRRRRWCDSGWFDDSVLQITK